MDDLAGLGKIIDSKVAEKVYDDSLARPAKELGSLAADLLHLIGSPVRLLRTFTDRAEKLVKDAVKKVPADRLREAPANVAGPILEKLRYCEDDSVFREMYLNLLTAAVDGERQQEDAHPEFPDIIGAMSASEAFFLWDLAHGDKVKGDFPEATKEALGRAVVNRLPQWASLPKPLLYSHLDHLKALGLIEFSVVNVMGIDRNYVSVSVELTAFGNHFVRVCLPDEDAVAAARAKGQPEQ